MFNKLKQFKDMRSQAKDLQGQLAEESTTTNSGGVSLTMDGNLDIKKIDISADLLNVDKKSKLEKSIIDAYDDAKKKMQRAMATKMKEMGGFPEMPGLS
jgi:nucleoid-associated protein EbfC